MAHLGSYVILLLVSLGLTSAFNITNVGWWKNTPFYQIYPRSFMDSNGDGIGDLNGITSKLQHFVDSGIGAIWLSPMYPSPMVDFGYDISDFKNVSSDYGTMADFEALTAKAKELKLKVILDLVPNHASDESEWFKKSEANETAYRDFFIWRDGKSATTPPNNWISVFSGPAWTYSEKRKQWYFHQFHKKQPDLNYNNPAVRTAMADVIWFWLTKGVDGFRVDAVPHLFEVDDLRDEPLSNITGANPNDYTYLEHLYTKDQPKTYELVRSWRDILDIFAKGEGSDERVMMTEAYTSLDKTVEFYDAGSHIPFNFKFITDVSNTSSPNDFKKLIDTWTTEANKRNGISNWVMGNHDRPRTETRYPERGDQMTMLAMILPGVSVTYYGEEIGMVDKDDITWEATQDPQGCQAGQANFKERSRDPCRTPFQWDDTAQSGFSNNASTWLPVNANYKNLNLKAQKETPVSHYNLYRALTKLKKTSLAVATGTLATVVKNNNQALAIVRTQSVNGVANETVVLVINFTPNLTLTVDLSSEVPETLNLTGVVEVATLNSPLQQGTMVDLSKLNLSPKSSLVIITNKKRTTNSGSGAESYLISFTKTTTILVAIFLITFR